VTTAEEQMVERLVEAFVAPLRDIGELLAKEIDSVREAVDDLEAKLIEKRLL
jgi:hypothetical protein